MKVVTPEQWYITFWLALTCGVCLFGWFAGPRIIARGLELWIQQGK